MTTPRPKPLRAVTFDYWDTLVDGAAEVERTRLRRASLRRLFADAGHPLDAEAVATLHREAGAELDRWWREEQRGYSTAEAVRLILSRGGVSGADDALVERTAVDINDALVAVPPRLIEGAAELLGRLAPRFAFAIVSDTGIASGDAQNRVLALHGILDRFHATVYSMDIGWCKPRPEPFRAALAALGVAPGEAIHVGDIERTDVRGALAVGMRAIRVDVVRVSGSSDAELVVTRLAEIGDYLLALS